MTTTATPTKTELGRLRYTARHGTPAERDAANAELRARSSVPGRSIILDTSAFTPSTDYPDGYLPIDLALGKITATGLYGPYDPAASDGTEVLAGYLLTPVIPGRPTTVDVPGVLLEHVDADEAIGRMNSE